MKIKKHYLKQMDQNGTYLSYAESWLFSQKISFSSKGSDLTGHLGARTRYLDLIFVWLTPWRKCQNSNNNYFFYFNKPSFPWVGPPHWVLMWHLARRGLYQCSMPDYASMCQTSTMIMVPINLWQNSDPFKKKTLLKLKTRPI